MAELHEGNCDVCGKYQHKNKDVKLLICLDCRRKEKKQLKEITDFAKNTHKRYMRTLDLLERIDWLMSEFLAEEGK